MPIREYECVRCGLRVERLFLAGQIAEGFSPTDVNQCPCECGCGELEEVFPCTNFRLKGAGFHKNDYGRPKDFKLSTDSKFKMRKELRDAVDHGEIPKGQNPYDSDAHKRPEPSKSMDEVYGPRSQEKVVRAIRRDKGSRRHEVNLGGGKKVRVTKTGRDETGRTEFALSEKLEAKAS